MSIRNRVRRGLVRLDKGLGLREWFRQNNGAGEEEQEAPQPSDPFAVSELPHPCPHTVLDIGASHGQFAHEALRAFPGVKIYSFEPIPECYQELLALSDTAPTVHPLNLALGDRDGEQDLWLSGFRDSSSLHEMLPAHLAAWPHTAIEKKITVKVARLDAVALNLALEGPVFAKIDVQGHELAVIRGGRSTLSLCERVMLECNFAPLYEGQPSFTQLYDELQSLGFLFDGFISPLRHPQTLELLSADAVFYKPAEIAEFDGL
jgi:FkbM family methyltransferase